MVTIVVEGDTDIPVVRKILELVDLAAGAVIDAGGKSKLDARLAAYNQAAKGSPWFILRDLDHDQPCAAALVEALVPASVRSELLCLRIAVREIESWLLADRSSIAKFLRVSPSLVPSAPDALEDPTRTIVDLARKSTKPAIVRPS